MESGYISDLSDLISACGDRGYLNSVISGHSADLTPGGLPGAAESYISQWVSRLSGLDALIWTSVELLQRNACASLANAADLLADLPSAPDPGFKGLVAPLRRVDELGQSLCAKHARMALLRTVSQLKSTLVANRRVLSLVDRWDEAIEVVHSIPAGSVDSVPIDHLERLRAVLISLRWDYDDCLAGVIRNDVPAARAAILAKYLGILEAALRAAVTSTTEGSVVSSDIVRLAGLYVLEPDPADNISVLNDHMAACLDALVDRGHQDLGAPVNAVDTFLTVATALKPIYTQMASTVLAKSRDLALSLGVGPLGAHNYVPDDEYTNLVSQMLLSSPRVDLSSDAIAAAFTRNSELVAYLGLRAPTL